METPTFLEASHSHSTYSGLPLAGAAPWDRNLGIVGQAVQRMKSPAWDLGADDVINEQNIKARKVKFIGDQMPPRRIVQVYIADTNENVPLDKSVLYTGEQKLTDSTDNELFFEIDIRGILDAYNKDRITFVDKTVKDRTQYLEPVKIRDLKMVVVTVATF